MKYWRSTLLGMLVMGLVGCSDPNGPRIPSPDDPGEDDPKQGVTIVADR